MIFVCVLVLYCTVGRRIQRAVKKTLQHARTKPTPKVSSAQVSLEDLELLVASLTATAASTDRGDDCIEVIDTRRFCKQAKGDTKAAREGADDSYFRVPVMFVSAAFLNMLCVMILEMASHFPISCYNM